MPEAADVYFLHYGTRAKEYGGRSIWAESLACMLNTMRNSTRAGCLTHKNLHWVCQPEAGRGLLVLCWHLLSNTTPRPCNSRYPQPAAVSASPKLTAHKAPPPSRRRCVPEIIDAPLLKAGSDHATSAGCVCGSREGRVACERERVPRYTHPLRHYQQACKSVDTSRRSAKRCALLDGVHLFKWDCFTDESRVG